MTRQPTRSNHRSVPKQCRGASSRRGAAAVEFAVAVSVLMVVVFASIEFARLNILKHSIEHASYLAARRGVITGANVNDVKQVVQDHLAILNVTGSTVTVTPDLIKDDTQMIVVNIDVPVTGNSWISPIYFSGTLSGRTRMLAERAASEMSLALPPSL